MTRGALATALAAVVMLAACNEDNADPGAEPTPASTATETEEPEPTPEAADEFDPTAGVPPELGFYYAQELTWKACGGVLECATVVVPLDYADPWGATIDLALGRVAARSAEPIGSLLFGGLGPGISAFEYVRHSRLFGGDVYERFDIVGFDPRGVGRSTAFRCEHAADLDELFAIGGGANDIALDALRQQHQKFVAGCVSRSGDLLPHLGTVNVVRDMDILRAVLGDEQLFYLGKSYGGYVGTRYAEMFPQRVGRIVLDGAVDPAVSGTEFLLGQALAAERALTAYLTWCVDHNSCPLGRSESEARAALSALLDIIGQDPLPTRNPDRPLTQPLAISGIIEPLYSSDFNALTEALEGALAGDGSGLQTLSSSPLPPVFYAVLCLDRPHVTDPAETEDLLAGFEAVSQTLGSFFARDALLCGEWPVEPDGEPAPVRAVGAAPILVVGMTNDLVTPYEWAESLAEQLDSGVLLTWDGSGHTAYGSVPCVNAIVDAYLVDGELPEDEDGLTC